MSRFFSSAPLRRFTAVLLTFLCALTLAPLQAQAADDVDVFYGDDAANDNRVVGVQVASSSNLANCKTCVGRLRDAGYNAYIYQAKKKTTSYCIVIGAYGRKYEAEDLLEEIRGGPSVKGVKMDHGFLVNTYLSDWGYDTYADPYYYVRSTSSSAKTSSTATSSGKQVSGGLIKDLADCKVIKHTDQGGEDIKVGDWKDNFGTLHENSIKFWVREARGYMDTETICYRVDNQDYTELSGCVVASTKNEPNAVCEVYIYVDGVCEYYSGLIDNDSRPDSFSIDVYGGCEIEVECTTDSNAFGHCIVAATLYR